MITELVARQRAYFTSGATKPVGVRIAALEKLQAAIRKNEGMLCDALKADLGKAPMEAYMTEIGIVLEELRFTLRHLPKWARTKKAPTPLAQFHAKSFVVPEPYGLALILSPWNYPFQLAIAPLIGAVAAGNCAILKPSAYAPATSRAIAELIGGCFDPSYIAVIEGGREQNQALLREKFDYIFFTGSVDVGRLVMESAAKNLTPVSLELGGKSPVIVDESANIALSAKRVAFGKALNAGQTCVAPDYVLVHQSVREPFLKALKAAFDAGFPNGDESELPTIVNEKHFDRLQGLTNSGSVYYGGRMDRETRRMSLTILDGVTGDDPVMREEIFGPILPVLTFETLDEAIRFVNERPSPLALYLFTENEQAERRVLDEIRFGGGCVNDTVIHLATSHMGFGGVGESGMGSYHGKLSFDTFTHYKNIVKKSTWMDLPMRYHPYTKKKDRMIRMFLK
ncbi:MAG TPA: aldehyde dehydrogenase [Feifaniaceae bacterium]|nr:aldehyde dehydrogenase [Feifaniaceae bacterium]